MIDETAPQGEALEAELAVTETETTAPVETGAETETETPKPSRGERRIAVLSAKLSAGEQERARMAAELEQFRSRANPQQERPLTEADLPRVLEERVAAELSKRDAEAKIQSFYKAGGELYADFGDRCKSLVEMGADEPFAALLLEMPDAARVVGALSDDPDEMERIAGLKTERARAIALGKYSAKLENAPPPAAKPVTRAPAPIRPIGGGSVKAVFNERTATPQQLMDYYSAQAMEARRR